MQRLVGVLAAILTCPFALVGAAHAQADLVYNAYWPNDAERVVIGHIFGAPYIAEQKVSTGECHFTWLNSLDPGAEYGPLSRFYAGSQGDAIYVLGGNGGVGTKSFCGYTMEALSDAEFRRIAVWGQGGGDVIRAAQAFGGPGGDTLIAGAFAMYGIDSPMLVGDAGADVLIALNNVATVLGWGEDDFICNFQDNGKFMSVDGGSGSDNYWQKYNPPISNASRTSTLAPLPLSDTTCNQYYSYTLLFLAGL